MVQNNIFTTKLLDVILPDVKEDFTNLVEQLREKKAIFIVTGYNSFDAK